MIRVGVATSVAAIAWDAGWTDEAADVAIEMTSDAELVVEVEATVRGTLDAD